VLQPPAPLRESRRPAGGGRINDFGRINSVGDKNHLSQGRINDFEGRINDFENKIIYLIYVCIEKLCRAGRPGRGQTLRKQGRLGPLHCRLAPLELFSEPFRRPAARPAALPLPPPAPPSRTNWTRLVPPSVLTGHVSFGASPRAGGPTLTRATRWRGRTARCTSRSATRRVRRMHASNAVQISDAIHVFSLARVPRSAFSHGAPRAPGSPALHLVVPVVVVDGRPVPLSPARG